jgi:alanine racemase
VASGPTIATIHLAAIRANFAEAKRRAEGREPIAVIKSDAYGHGAIPVARTLQQAGCRWYAVVRVAEAVVLREAGFLEPVLVLGGVADAEEGETAVALDLVPVVHHAGHVALLANAARNRAEPLPIHVEVDTGMKRTGIPADCAGALFEAIVREPALAMTGVFTHFARADEQDLDPSFEQLRAFGVALGEARKCGLDPSMVHTANSAALLADKALIGALPEQTAARPGGMLFGVRPSPRIAVALQPAMTLRTQVAQLRSAKAGDPVGYSALFRARHDTRVATLPIGYEDGLPVSASDRRAVLIRGRRMPIAGQVSMNFTTVDVGDSPVEIGDEVILFGEGQGDECLTVEEAADAAGTIAYELLVSTGRRVRRKFED